MRLLFLIFSPNSRHLLMLSVALLAVIWCPAWRSGAQLFAMDLIVNAKSLTPQQLLYKIPSKTFPALRPGQRERVFVFQFMIRNVGRGEGPLRTIRVVLRQRFFASPIVRNEQVPVGRTGSRSDSRFPVALISPVYVLAEHAMQACPAITQRMTRQSDCAVTLLRPP
jgi:hypothetical protein